MNDDDRSGRAKDEGSGGCPPGILVTGAAGFIGEHLVDALLGQGEHVVGLDVRKREVPSGEDSVGGFSFVQGDVRDRELVRRILREENIGTIYHLAALTGVRDSFDAPEEYRSVNVGGTATLMSAISGTGVRRLVFAGSSSIYGIGQEPPFVESGGLLPISPYGASKLEAEETCRRSAKESGVTLSICRLFTVYGPKQRKNMAIRSFAEAIFDGRPVVLYGEGKSRRDYTYVDDAVRGLIHAAGLPEGVDAMNVGSGVATGLDELVHLLREIIGLSCEVIYGSSRAGDVESTLADLRKARSLGYEPRIPLQEGLRHFVAWLKDRRDASLSNGDSVEGDTPERDSAEQDLLERGSHTTPIDG